MSSPQPPALRGLFDADDFRCEAAAAALLERRRGYYPTPLEGWQQDADRTARRTAADIAALEQAQNLQHTVRAAIRAERVAGHNAADRYRALSAARSTHAGAG